MNADRVANHNIFSTQSSKSKIVTESEKQGTNECALQLNWEKLKNVILLRNAEIGDGRNNLIGASLFIGVLAVFLLLGFVWFFLNFSLYFSSFGLRRLLGFSSVVFIILSTVGGYFVCCAIFQRPPLQKIIQELSVRHIKHKFMPDFEAYSNNNNNNNNNSNDNSCATDINNKRRKNYQKAPWESIQITQQINDELEDLFETIIENYVNNWYKEGISADNAFLLEIRHQIRYATSVILTRLHKTNFTQLITDLLPSVVTHLERIFQQLDQFNEELLKSSSTSTLEMLILNQLPDLHYSVLSYENEVDYLRLLADIIVERCVDISHIGGGAIDSANKIFCSFEDNGFASTNFRLWPSHSCQHFLREIVLFTILRPTIDVLMEPDFLNHGILTALMGGLDEIDLPVEKKKVEFLNRLTDLSQNLIPDSLLSIKLNDLVREPRLIQLFDMYLRDIDGPCHLLDCFLQARDVHKRIQCVQQKPPTEDYQSVLSEIESDAWQLYSAFVHESAPNQIDFSSEVCTLFDAAITAKDLQRLEKAAEDIYKEIYQKLHFNYVIPFCQSESYLGYLCGAPPDVEELIRSSRLEDETSDSGSASQNIRAEASGTSFSLSQFRNKLFSVIGNKNTTSLSTSSKDTESTSSASPSTDEFFYDDSHRFQTDRDCETGEIALIDLGRDLNRWKVTISTVESRRELISSKMYFVYVIEVKRNDLAASEFSGDSRSTDQNKSILTKADTLNFERNCFDDEEENISLLKLRSFNSIALGDRVEEELIPVSPTTNFSGEYDAETEILPSHWTTSRKYNEFFLLEEKIREFHGNSLRIGVLPDRKTFLTTKNRSLMEAHRPLFERFLQTLIQQTALKRSDLLYDFLTLSEDEWMDEPRLINSSFLPDLRNPFRAMRRMPTKLARERGQNLRPFILNMLANILVPRTAVYSTNISNDTVDENKETKDATRLLLETNRNHYSITRLDSFSLFLENFESISSAENCVTSTSPQSPPNSLQFGLDPSFQESKLNCWFVSDTEKEDNISRLSDWTPSCHPIDDCLNQPATLKQYFKDTGVYGIVTFLLLRVVKISHWFEAIFLSIGSFFATLINDLISYYIRKRFIDGVLFQERTILCVIQSFQKMLSDCHQQTTLSTSSNEEKRLRADLALRLLEEATKRRVPSFLMRLLVFSNTYNGVDDLHSIFHKLFLCFQLPRLNKQLAFVLIDQLIEHFLTPVKQ